MGKLDWALLLIGSGLVTLAWRMGGKPGLTACGVFAVGWLLWICVCKLREARLPRAVLVLAVIILAELVGVVGWFVIGTLERL